MRTAARRRTRSASSATTTPSSGTRATTSSRASRVGLAGNASRLAHAGAVRGPRLPQRGRQAALHRQVRRAPVRHRPRHPALRPVRQRRSARSTPAIAARCRTAARLGRRRQRRLEYWFGAAVVNEGAGLDRTPAIRSTSTASGNPFDGIDPGPSTAPTAPRTRTTTRRSSRPAACCRPPTTRSSTSRASPEVRPARRAVRAAHGRLLRVLADRRRLVQAPDAHDQRARRRRDR